MQVGDYTIPKATMIFASLYHIMNDPDHFKNPHNFNPERFMDSDGKFVSDERVVPFGIGKRICLGQTLAEKEFYIFFAGIVQQFELQRDTNTELPSYDINDSFPKGVLSTALAFNLKLKHRLKQA
jgi:cytochrome P450